MGGESRYLLAYHGERGSFSEEAAEAYVEAYVAEEARGAAELVGLPKAALVVRHVLAGRAEVGILGFANPYSGTNGETAEAMEEAALIPVATIVLPVAPALFVLPGTVPSELKQVFSHPASLYQCERTLRRLLPDAVQVATPTSARAAVLLSGGQLPAGSAVLCSRHAGEIHGLHMLRPDMSDYPGRNETAFTAFVKPPRQRRRGPA